MCQSAANNWLQKTTHNALQIDNYYRQFAVEQIAVSVYCREDQSVRQFSYWQQGSRDTFISHTENSRQSAHYRCATAITCRVIINPPLNDTTMDEHVTTGWAKKPDLFEH